MRPFVPMLAQHLGVRDQELREKDIRLHTLLASLVRDPTFGPHLAFKGGTCLIKCYLNYPRFSTDLDFTWMDGPGPRPPLGGTKAFRRGSDPHSGPSSHGSEVGPGLRDTRWEVPSSSATVGAIG